MMDDDDDVVWWRMVLYDVVCCMKVMIMAIHPPIWDFSTHTLLCAVLTVWRCDHPSPTCSSTSRQALSQISSGHSINLAVLCPRKCWHQLLPFVSKCNAAWILEILGFLPRTNNKVPSPNRPNRPNPDNWRAKLACKLLKKQCLGDVNLHMHRGCLLDIGAQRLAACQSHRSKRKPTCPTVYLKILKTWYSMTTSCANQ